MNAISIGVLGPLRVSVDGAPVSGFEYTKVRALLAYLAVGAGRDHPRAVLCTLLWPDLPEKTARRNLTQALSGLRRALVAAGAEQALTTTSEAVRLEAGPGLRVDALRFEALVDEAEAHAHRGWHTCHACGERLREAAALYEGDFLSQLYVADSTEFEEWALGWRERLRQRMMTALERLARAAEWRGQWAAAAALARRQVELDGLNEAGHREVMRLLALDGQQAAAEAQFDRLRRTLRDELHAAPDEATMRLQADIRGGAVERLRRYAAPPVEGPARPNALVGRQTDLQAVCALARDEAVRAITLTGTPGVGKTRLALEAAQALRFDFEDGVHFVELAPVGQADGVAGAIAATLGVNDKANQPLTARIVAGLRARHALLVLDNFEHVLEAAGLVGEVLAGAPGVKVLVTSRAPLRVRAEHQYPVAPLGLADEADPERASQAEAVQLFVSRARAARPGFELTAENAAAVNAICERLNGLPLAIELIAARARTHEPRELLRQLGQGLEALALGARDGPERHHSLRNAIRWSYERLDGEAQQVFAHLGVFAGGCTAEAAQAVAGPEIRVGTVLERLHEASLTQAHTAGGVTRFGMLETLREFALEALEARGQLEEARRRHAEHYLGLAEGARPELTGPNQKQRLDELEGELPNMRAALRWSQGQAPEMHLRLAAALDLLWNVRGLAREGRGWLREGLRLGGKAPAEARARALLAASWLAWKQGDHTEAAQLAEQGQQLYLNLEDAGGLAWSHYNLGMAVYNLGDFDQAEARFREGLEVARGIPHWHLEALALNGLANVAVRRGDYGGAVEIYRQVLRLHEAKDNYADMAGIMQNLGVVEYEQGNVEAARGHGEAALRLGRQLGDRNIVKLCLLNLANAMLAMGDAAGARGYLEETVAMQRAQGDTESLSAPLNALGRALLELGETRAARPHLEEGLRLRQEAKDERGTAVSLEALARLEFLEGKAQLAAQLFDESGAIRERLKAPVTPARRAEYERWRAEVREAVGGGKKRV